MTALPLDPDEPATLSKLHTSFKEGDASCSFQIDDGNGCKKQDPPAAPISVLLFFVLFSCCLTGLLLGYDLCVVSTILEPIKNDFGFCPSQIIQPLPFYTNEVSLPVESTTDINATTRALANDEDALLSSTRQRRLPPSPCYRQQQIHSRSLGADTTLENAPNSVPLPFKSCPAGQHFVSVISPGAALGSIFSGPFADYAGRILTLALADLFIMTGTLLMAFAASFHALFLGRFTLGIGIGIGFVIFSTYVTECAPENWRGRMVSSIEVAQCVGCLASFAATAMIGNDHWRWLLTAAGSVAGVQLIGVFLLPESPRWYIRKNQPLKAQNSLRRLAGLPEVTEQTGDNSLGVDLTSSNGVLIPAEAGVNVTDPNEERSASKTKKYERTRMKEAGVRTTMKKMIDEYQREKQHHYNIQHPRCGGDFNCDVDDDYEYLRFSSNVNDNVIDKKFYSRESSQTTVEMATKDSNSSSSSNNSSGSHIGERTLETQENDSDEAYEEKSEEKSEKSEIDTSSLGKADNINGECSVSLPLQTAERPTRLNSLFKSSTFFNECKRHSHQIMISIGCAFCQNLTASTAVLYYSTELFQLGGVSQPFLAGIGIGVAKILGILSVIFFIERIGRRNFLLIGTSSTMICHLGFAVCYSALQPIDIHLTSILITVIMFIFMFSQNISWAGLMFVVSSEVLPSSVRGIGMTLTITSFWLLAFVTQLTFETLMEALTVGGVFLFYAVTTFFALIFTYFWIPDFSGHTLEEITRIFEERKERKSESRWK